MNTLRINNRNYHGPACWEELKPNDYLLVIAAVHAQRDLELADYEDACLRTELIRTLYRIKPLDFVGSRSFFYKRKLRANNDFLCAQWLDEVLPLVDFAFNDTVFTKNLLPSFSHKLARYYGPADGLINTIGEEIEKALLFNTLFAQTNDPQCLRRLVATLYRPMRRDHKPNDPGYGGDARQDYNENLIEQRADAMRGVDPRVLFGVRHWFNACLEHFHERDEPLFRRSKDAKAEVNLEDFRRLQLELAGTKLGSFEEVKKANFHEIMFYVRELERKRIEFDENNKP